MAGGLCDHLLAAAFHLLPRRVSLPQGHDICCRLPKGDVSVCMRACSAQARVCVRELRARLLLPLTSIVQTRAAILCAALKRSTPKEDRVAQGQAVLGVPASTS